MYVHAEHACNTFFLDDDIGCKLEDIMIFFSGSSQEPPCGFEHTCGPTIKFLNNEEVLPTASTCTLELRLPTNHRNYETFKEAMITGIMGNDGFGLV